MIGDVRTYFHLRKRTILSKRYSKLLGSNRQIDIYWSDENQNYIVTKKGKTGILKEFITGRNIVFSDLVKMWQNHEHGNSYRQELKLQEIAIQANKDKKAAEKREEKRYYAGEAWDYGVAEKRSILVGG
jgi:hypothetical protein